MATSTTGSRTHRASSDERREQVVHAAVKEFAANGFHAASTGAIARRAGISQPYIYALFPNKRELFLAAHSHVTGRIRDAFSAAAEGKDGPEERLQAMGEAYAVLLEDRDEIVLQMQAHAAAGDPELGDPVRREFTGIVDHVERLSGAPRDRVMQFMATGMLMNVAAALGLPGEFCAFALG